jgi:nicotinic acid mononucleotide adenylyltransferase
VADGLPTWKSVHRLLEQVKLLIFERARQHQLASHTGQAVLARLRQTGLQLLGAEVIQVSTPAVDATGIRARIAQGLSSAEMLAPEVADYIASHRLYREVSDPDR